LDATNVASTSVWTIAGVDTTLNISISGAGAQYRINGGTWTNASQTGAVSSGNTIEVRGTAPSTYSSTNTITVTVGSGTGSYEISTISDPGGGGGTSYGLQLFDASGNIKFDTTDRNGFLLERLDVPSLTANGGQYSKTYNVSILAGIPVGSGWFFNGVIPYNITITQSGNTITITNNTPTIRTGLQVLVISGG